MGELDCELLFELILITPNVLLHIPTVSPGAARLLPTFPERPSLAVTARALPRPGHNLPDDEFPGGLPIPSLYGFPSKFIRFIGKSSTGPEIRIASVRPIIETFVRPRRRLTAWFRYLR